MSNNIAEQIAAKRAELEDLNKQISSAGQKPSPELIKRRGQLQQELGKLKGQQGQQQPQQRPQNMGSNGNNGNRDGNSNRNDDESN